MRIYYNRFAGQSLERLSALSDGIFAVAMTLLVLNLQIPSNAGIGDEGTFLLKVLRPFLPHLLTYFMSFLTLGIFWVGQQTQLNQFARTNRHLTWIHLAFLLAVSLMPFSTSLLASFITFRLALIVYWLNILLLGAVLFCSWRYALHAGLVKEEITAEARSAVQRRIVIAQALYAFGVLLCLINTYVSIAFIVLVQLNYAIAPKIRLLDGI